MSPRLVVWHRWLSPRREAVGARRAVAQWRQAVEGRLTVSGATLLGSVGGSIAATFDPADLLEVAELALELLDEADEGSLEIALGLAIGDVETVEGVVVGGAIERAQLLASRAKAGEVVLDPAARDGVADTLLFGRQVAAGPGMPRGTTLDRAHPRRLECADAIARLGATALPPVIASVRTRIEEELTSGSSRTFLLRGPVGAGTTELIGDLERRVRPSEVWRIGAAPGGVVPLASLRLALARRFGSPEEVRAGLVSGPEAAGAADVMARVAAGQVVPIELLGGAITALLRRRAEGGARPWVVLSPLGLVDGATLAALLEARERGGDFVIFGRLPVETSSPRPLGELDETVRELTLPPLKVGDARVVAEAILGPDTDDDVARRVAVLGGDTVLGVVEAARTLIATGDLVHHGRGFVWRAGPRSGAHAIGTDALLSERLQLIDAHARRVLEALCVVPDGSRRELLAAVVAQDGVPEDRVETSLSLLVREALARGQERPRPATSLLRWRVLSLIPPARAMELHRFVGRALRAELGEAPSAEEDLPRRVELGYFLVEGGTDPDGRALITEALEPLLERGYERAARQLSGWLTAAHADARVSSPRARATPPPPPSEAHEEPPPSNEIALDELLEEMAGASATPPRTPPPPPAPRAAAPERPASPAAPPPPPSAAAAAPPPPPPAPPAPPPARRAAASQPPAPPGAPQPPPPSAAVPPPPPPAALPGPAEKGGSSMRVPRPGPPQTPLEPAAASPAADPSRGADTIPGALDAEIDALLDEPAAFEDSTDTVSVALAPEGDDSARTPVLDDAVDELLGEAWADGSSVGLASEPFGVERTSVAPAPMRPYVEEVVRAIRDRDFEELERVIDRAVEDGSEPGAVARVRALAELARGDVSAARRCLRAAHPRGRSHPAARARYHLAEALLELRAGEPMAGIRAALTALADSRRLTDPRGETAALHALAACYQALGRDELAVRLRPAS